jgi:trk system potassium uptake protein TrkA
VNAREAILTARSNRCVILGCGRQGARLAQLLEAEQYHVCIIDRLPAAFSRLHDFQGERLLGNGTDEDVLKRAGVEDAYAFAAVTNGDNTNLMAAQIARVIFEVPRVVCRVYDPARAGIYHDLGLETVSATTVGARMIRNLIIPPKILRQYQLGDGTASAMEFKVGTAIEGSTVASLELEGEFRIACVVRDQVPIVPTPAMTVQANDYIFGVVSASAVSKVSEKLDVRDYAINFPSRGGY